MNGWMAKPSEDHHNALVLHADDNGEYPWACSCGAGELDITYQDAQQAVEEHLNHYELVDAPCAGLPRGQHWYQVVVTLAHGLAGDENEQFPMHLTKEDIHGLFVRAKAMLAEIEPSMGRMCRMCRDWECDINIAEIGR